MKPIVALVDCNNFYASCERVFDPKLWERPVAVLSNNDGCVVARSNEVKKLGVKIGTPLFKCEAILRKHNAAIFSSNYTLYGNMSSRVMNTLSLFTPDIEVYSIDEAFLSLSGFERVGIDDYARKIRDRVFRWTGIPVTVGVGETKVLSKIATRIAKKHPKCHGTFNVVDHPRIDDILERIPVGKIWGIGRQYTKLLLKHGMETARDVKYAEDKWVKKNMTVVGLRLVHELRGENCIELDEVPAPKKEICCSRSFGKPVQTLEELQEAVSEYATTTAEKLRRQRSGASIMIIFISTNPFKTEPQYHRSIQVSFPSPTMNTLLMVKYARRAVERIYKAGFNFKKAGVILSGIVPDAETQLDLMWKPDDDKVIQLMRDVDGINEKYGSRTVQVASSGIKKSWNMKRCLKSPHYTTRWDELPLVKTN